MAKPRAKRPPTKPAAAKATSGRVRNRALEGKLVAHPEDPATRQVYADWLQSVGDPLGELLALENAGETKLARKLLTRQWKAILGNVDEDAVEWRGGLIHHVRLQGDSSARARKQCTAIFERPASLIVGEMTLGPAPDRALVAHIGNHARTLRMLTCDAGPGIGALAIPTLEYLQIYLVRESRLDLRALAPVLAATRVPGLRRLDFVLMSKGKPVALDVLEALLASKLLRQLEWLAFRQEALDRKGVALLVRRREALAHLRGVYIDSCWPEDIADIAEAFGEQSETRPGSGKHAGYGMSIGAFETWPSPSHVASAGIEAADARDLAELRRALADEIERYWKVGR